MLDVSNFTFRSFALCCLFTLSCLLIVIVVVKKLVADYFVILILLYRLDANLR